MSGQASQAIPAGFASLRQRVLRAGGWSLGGYVAGQLIRFATNLLMTRLLVPEMFGVMAIALMVMIGLALFSDFGLKQSVVQSRRGSEAEFLNTAWSVQILRGGAIALCALGAGLLFRVAATYQVFGQDSAYAAPELAWIVAALGFGAVLTGLESTKVYEASRNLALARLTQIDVVSLLAGVAAMVGLALAYRSIWVLVIGSLVTSLVRMVLTHLWLPGTRNRLQWDRDSFREILGFGKWIFVSSVLGFAATSGDRILLGGMIDARTLGVYSIALLLFNAMEQVLGRVMGDVAFPALSEVARDRRADLRRTVYRFHLPLAAFAYASGAALMLAAPAIVSRLYDSRYHEAGWMLQILAAALITIPARVHAMCLLSLGLSRLHSNLMLVRLLTLVVALPVGFHLLGLPGALLGVLLSFFAVVPVTLVYAARERLVDPLKEAAAFPALALGVLVGAAMVAVIGR